ncbi:Interferon-inducible GTPase 5 [Seminavis robusta]|uniref:Interferon-inducible GTPase 5 n=1 Tax=Seminavis robusta TaxID=568900 RepID=A0A9N8EML5_9STRA|nr:Interferon-inducible GTPase 5 [Seminavis robusta]|eukprot:Sro1182_g249990.1 Interferon-inducible GTPase 5 (452) ;mRNA; f:26431-27974
MGGKSSHHHYHVDEAATRAATEAAQRAEAAANQAREAYLRQAEQVERQAAERKERERQAQEAAARHQREIENERRQRAEAEARRVAEQQAASAKLKKERDAAAARLEEIRKQAQQRAKEQAEIARQEAEAAAVKLKREPRVDAIRNERNRVHAERLKERKELNRDYPIPEHLAPFVTGVLNTVDEDAAVDRFINVGFLGYSGVGKSSLISKLLKFFADGDQEDFPLTSFESDGTTQPTPYVVKGFDGKVRLWDLPGQGTEMFPSKSYLRDMGLKYFDAVLVVTDGRWKTNDTTLLDAIRFADIWFKVVRTKIDQAVEAGAHDHGMTQEAAIEVARAKLAEKINNLALADPSRLHLVTSREHFWIGAHGDRPFGLLSTLCKEVENYIEERAEEAYGGLEIPAPSPSFLERDDGEDIGVEVDENLNFEAAAVQIPLDEPSAVSSVGSRVSVRS